MSYPSVSKTTDIFLSYRRNDAPGYVARLANDLVDAFGDVVFRDVDSILAGDEWKIVLQRHVSHAKVVLALIGADWMEELTRRRDVSTDYVRYELNLARSLRIPVIPILFDGATLGNVESLGELSWLLDIQAFSLSDVQQRWPYDSKILATQLSRINGLNYTTPKLSSTYKQEFYTYLSRFYDVLFFPEDLFKKINHDSTDELIRSFIFAILVSIINLIIVYPIFLSLNNDNYKSYFVFFLIIDTVITLGIWLLYSEIFYLSARILGGKGSPRSTIVAFLYLTAFIPLLSLLSLPIEGKIRKTIFEYNHTMILPSYDLLYNPSMILIGYSIVEIIIYLILFNHFSKINRIIHSVEPNTAKNMTILGFIVWQIIALTFQIPIQRLLWLSFAK